MRILSIIPAIFLAIASVNAADVKISDLPETNAPSATALLPIVDAGVTWKVQKKNLLGYLTIWTNYSLPDVEGGIVHGAQIINPISTGTVNFAVNYLTNFAGAQGTVNSIGSPSPDVAAIAAGENTSLNFIGDWAGNGTPFDGCWGVDVFGNSAAAASYFTNCNQLQLFGSQTAYTSFFTNSFGILALGAVSLYGANGTNLSNAAFLSPGSGQNSSFQDVAYITLSGHGSGYGSTFTNVAHFTGSGSDSVANSVFDGVTESQFIGEGAASQSHHQNSGYNLIVGRNAGLSGNYTNANKLFFAGYQAGQGSSLTNAQMVTALGAGAGMNLAGTYQNVVYIGDGSTSGPETNKVILGPNMTLEIPPTGGLTLGGVRQTSWPAVGVTGTVVTNGTAVSTGDIAAFGTASTNLAKATSANLISALGYTPQPASAALTNLASGIGTGLTNLGPIRVDMGTQTTVSNALTLTAKYNEGSTVFKTLQVIITNTASSASSFPIELLAGTGAATSEFSVDTSGNIRNAGQVISSGQVSSGGNLQLSAAGLLDYSARSRVASPADGVLVLQNHAQNAFTRLSFGTNGAGGVGLALSGTTLSATLGDGTGVSTLISQGAPLYEGKVATVTGVDVNTGTKSTIYTVPASKTLIVTKVIVRNASTSLTTASFGFGFNANADDVIASATHTELTGNTLYTLIEPKVGAIKGNAADNFGLKCTVNQGGAATVDVDVFGFFF